METWNDAWLEPKGPNGYGRGGGGRRGGNSDGARAPPFFLHTKPPQQRTKGTASARTENIMAPTAPRLESRVPNPNQKVE